jgi:TRAP-type C4-dicarboxylate transport system permease small subunit
MSRLARLLATIEQGCAIGSALAMATIMFVVVIDVVMRYAFNAPLTWSYDGIGMVVMPAAFFLMLSWTYRRGHHVNVDILVARLPLAGRRLSSLLGALLAAPVFGTMAALAALEAQSTFERGLVLAGSIAWPTWIPSAIAAAGLMLFTSRLLFQAMLLIVLLVRPATPVSQHLASDTPHGRD